MSMKEKNGQNTGDYWSKTEGRATGSNGHATSCWSLAKRRFSQRSLELTFAAEALAFKLPVLIETVIHMSAKRPFMKELYR
jgi:hypothetical protein